MSLGCESVWGSVAWLGIGSRIEEVVGQEITQEVQDMQKQSDVVAKLVGFQKTGKGFDGVWEEIGPIVKEFARRNLRKMDVIGGESSWAVDDVVSQTVEKLMGLSASGAGGRFNPAKAKPGLAGVRAWLWAVVKNQAVNWVRANRGGRGVKVLSESVLSWNELGSGKESESFLERIVAKIDRPELLPILQECINRLPDPVMREMVQLKLDEELSVRGTADRTGIHKSSVQRNLTSAYEMLRPMLEERGVDVSWLAA